MTITGTLFLIEGKLRKTDKMEIQEFILDASTFDIHSGDRRENYLKFQCINNKCSLLNGFKVGDSVTVSFYPNGRFYQKDGKDLHIQNNNVFKIEAFKR